MALQMAYKTTGASDFRIAPPFKPCQPTSRFTNAAPSIATPHPTWEFWEFLDGDNLA